MTGVGLAVLAGFFFGILFVLTRQGLRRAPHPIAGAAVTDVVAFLACVVVAAVGWPDSLDGVRLADLWPFVLAGALAPGLSQGLFVHAVRTAGPSRSSIVMGSAPLVSAVAAILILGEPFRPALVVGWLLVVAGAVSLGWDRARPAGFRPVGIVFAFACVLLFASRDNIVRWGTTGETSVPPPVATAVVVGTAALTSLVWLAVTERRRAVGLARSAALPFVPAGLAIGFAYVALTEALARTRVGIVAPLLSTQALWGVGLAALVVGRAEMITRRVVLAALLIVAGAATVGAFA